MALQRKVPEGERRQSRRNRGKTLRINVFKSVHPSLVFLRAATPCCTRFLPADVPLRGGASPLGERLMRATQEPGRLHSCPRQESEHFAVPMRDCAKFNIRLVPAAFSSDHPYRIPDRSSDARSHVRHQTIRRPDKPLPPRGVGGLQERSRHVSDIHEVTNLKPVSYANPGTRQRHIDHSRNQPAGRLVLAIDVKGP